ncbi:MAG: hypothetical protein K1X88_00545 [Nannocystaceae bacterium]|nr:hypothetical protein [Nannocystaceae bacterium]
MTRRGATGFVALLWALPSCLQPREFPCASDVDCVVDDRHGRCVEPGYCAYDDDGCASQLRYGPAAGMGLAGRCVDDPVDHEGTTDTGGSSGGSDGCGPCTSPPPCYASPGSCVAGACAYLPELAGVACGLDDPCIEAAHCDGMGMCVIDEPHCNAPPGGCYQAPGHCDAQGGCSYDPKPVNAMCEDGDGCSLGDRCDGEGTCIAGPPCPSDNPCAVGSCGTSGQCSFFPIGDGEACPTGICCGGSCVDPTSDAGNCGGCGVVCPPPQQCSAGGGTPSCM